MPLLGEPDFYLRDLFLALLGTYWLVHVSSFVLFLLIFGDCLKTRTLQVVVLCFFFQVVTEGDDGMCLPQIQVMKKELSGRCDVDTEQRQRKSNLAKDCRPV